MNKAELRKIYKQKRKKFSTAEIEFLSLKILENLKQMNIWDFTVFHCFLPISSQNEINTFPIINSLFAQNKRVVVPKMEGLNLLNCEIQRDVELKFGNFKTLEPKEIQIIQNQEIEVIFLPMLICDKSGNRIGYGAGFYDRWLNQFERGPLKIGLNFFEPIDEIQDVNAFDIPIDYCVTPDGIESFISGMKFKSLK